MLNMKVTIIAMILAYTSNKAHGIGCPYTATAAKGGTTCVAYGPATTAALCQAACDQDSTCKSYDYTTTDGTGCRKCTDATPDAAGTLKTYQLKDPTCTACLYAAMAGMKGTTCVADSAATTAALCEASCSKDATCIGFEHVTADGSVCKKCTDVTPAAEAANTLQIKGNCGVYVYAEKAAFECTTGVDDSTASTTAALCEASCSADSACLGIEYVTSGGTGCKKCSDVTPVAGATKTLKVKGNFGACAYATTASNGCTTGAADSPSTTALLCEASCNIDSTCLGYDYLAADGTGCRKCTDVTADSGAATKTLRVKGTCGVGVTCIDSGFTITNLNTDFGDSSYQSVIITDTDGSGTACPATAATLAKSATKWTVAYATANVDKCYTDGSTIIDGTSFKVIKAGTTTSAKITYRYGGADFQTAKDTEGTITCSYAFPDFTSENNAVAVGTYALQSLGGVTANKEFDISSSTSLKVYKKSDLSEVTNSNTITFETDTVCVAIKSTSSNIADINIKTFTFMKTSGATTAADKIEYIVDYCAKTNTKVRSVLEAPAAYETGGSCTNLVVNCAKQRAVCFKPFAFNVAGTATATTLYVTAVVSPEGTAGYHAGATCTDSSANFIGRKKRDAESEEKDFTLSTLIPIVREVVSIQQEQIKACESTSYMIAIVVLAAAFIFSTIIAIFSFRMHYSSKINAMA